MNLGRLGLDGWLEGEAWRSHQQIGLRLYAIMFISIDYTRLFTNLYDYIRLYPIILLQIPKRLYAIISKDDYFTYCTTIISLFFFLRILLWLSRLCTIMCIICFANYYTYYYIWDELLWLFFPEPTWIMCIMRNILHLFELFFCLTIITVIFFQCYYTYYFFPNRLSSL